jgi:hypothetical protein
MTSANVNLRLEKENSGQNVFHEERLLGFVRPERNKWAVYHEAQELESSFYTRLDALRWLVMLDQNAEATKHLRALRHVADIRTPSSEELERSLLALSTDYCNFFDVLRSFVVSLGMYVTHAPCAILLERCPNAWGAYYKHDRIYLRPHSNTLAMCNVLAHELAHHYELVLDLPAISYEKHEQLAESVAYAIMQDYQCDASSWSFDYIAFWSNCYAKGVADGALDMPFIACYTAFSENLRTFFDQQ